MQLISCTYESHADAILDILNEAIVNSTALYDYKPRPPESMVGWFNTKTAGHFPVVGAINDAGQLMGFTSYGTFRAWPAYKYSVEHSIYIHKEQELEDVERRYPADHYVLIDDKLRILAAVKQVWGTRVTTIFPRQGHYAHDPQTLASYPPADVSVERIGDLLNYDLPALLAKSMTPG